jgi:predicted nucleic acid-binding protein
VIFDSDVLIWFLRGDPDAAALVDSAGTHSVSIVSVMEVLRGAKSKREMAQFKGYLRERSFRIRPLTESIGNLAVELIEQHGLSGGLDLADALIAAGALEDQAILATANVRHFRSISRLQIKQFRPRRH